MNELLKDNKSEIERLKRATRVNKSLPESMSIIEVSRYPLVVPIFDDIRANKILLMYDEGLKHSAIRFFKEKDYIYVNVSEHIKQGRGTAGNIYNMDSKILYAYLLGAYTILHNDYLMKNRDTLKEILEVYLELVKKPLLRNKHITSETERAKLDYILLIYILNNNETSITNYDGFATKMSGIQEHAKNMLFVNNPELKSSKIKDFNLKKLHDILEKEFIAFKKEFKYDSIIFNTIYMYGASNVTLLNDLSTTSAIIVDYSLNNKAVLNILKHNWIKDCVNSKVYNSLITNMMVMRR